MRHEIWDIDTDWDTAAIKARDDWFLSIQIDFRLQISIGEVENGVLTGYR